MTLLVPSRMGKVFGGSGKFPCKGCDDRCGARFHAKGLLDTGHSILDNVSCTHGGAKDFGHDCRNGLGKHSDRRDLGSSGGRNSL